MTAIIAYLLNNRLARFIGGALVAIASVLTFGAVKRRQGAQEAKAKQRAEKAEAAAKGEAAVADSHKDGLTWQERLKRNRGGK